MSYYLVMKNSIDRMSSKIENENTSDQIVAEKIFRELEDFENKGGMSNSSFEDFEKLLISINGISRNKDDLDFMDAPNSEVIGKYRPPKIEDRRVIFNNLFLDLEKIEDADYRAALAFYTIGLAHAFADGNGRTSRIMYGFLKNGISDNIVGRIGHDGDYGQNSSGRPMEHPDLMAHEDATMEANKELLREIFNDDISRVSVNDIIYNDLIKNRIDQGDYNDPIRRAFITHCDFFESWLDQDTDFNTAIAVWDRFLNKNRDKTNIREVVYGKIIDIDADEVSKYIEEDDLKFIGYVYDDIKIQKMKILNDFFVSPDKYKRPDGQTVADYLVKRNNSVDL